MSFGYKLGLGSLLLLSSWACQPDLDSLVAGYPPGYGGTSSAGSAGTAGSDTDAGDAGAPPAGPRSCENQLRNSDESDVDCGGISKCPRCEVKFRCNSNSDCASDFCKGSRCAEPSCSDDVKNQDETATDCGGSCAPELGCDLGAACVVGQDCKSEFCSGDICANHCTSGVREADETDKDCGGSTCEPCADHGRCKASSDCESLVCFNNECQPATCSDKVKNQDESEKDCGGVCAATKPCAIGVHCNGGADCESWVCTKNKCAPDIDIPTADVIDDFEDGDFNLKGQAGRVGTWYAYGDGSGTVTEAIGAIERGASTKGIRNTGQDFTSWGCGVGVDLDNAGGMQSTKKPYDASAYSGITFWARAKSAMALTVVLPDADTDAAGKLCTTCDHHFYKPIQVSTTWERFTVAFDEVTLEPGVIPEPASFDPSGLVSVQLRVASGTSYELWIDDLAFVR